MIVIVIVIVAVIVIMAMIAIYNIRHMIYDISCFHMWLMALKPISRRTILESPLSGSLVYLGDSIHHILAFLASYAG